MAQTAKIDFWHGSKAFIPPWMKRLLRPARLLALVPFPQLHATVEGARIRMLFALLFLATQKTKRDKFARFPDHQAAKAVGHNQISANKEPRS